MSAKFGMVLFLAIGLATALWRQQAIAEDGLPDADIIVVGAGIAGLTTALEAESHGLGVLVVDMWSVFGGHAVMSSGNIAIVGTPYQEAEEIEDSVELAMQDFHTHGEVADPDWVRLYCSRSREWVFDWLGSRGVGWEGLTPYNAEGNSVRRMHAVEGRGMGLVAPLFRHCAQSERIRFRWNEKVIRLLEEGGRITGVEVENQRDRSRRLLRSRHVVIATGGFQSNLELVRENWPGLDREVRVLKGAGINAMGSGLELAGERGARVERLDLQWNYRRGLPHPQDKTGERGLGVWIAGGLAVNLEGRRFMNGMDGPKLAMPAVLRQPEGSYFQVFDRDGRKMIFVSGSGWEDEDRIRKEIFENPALAPYVKRADTIAGLAEAMDVDTQVLEATIRRWNGLVDAGEDKDFGRPIHPRFIEGLRVSNPPFFAVRFFPMTRKSFGGLAVDTSCRVLDNDDHPIPGLLAAGEVTGFGGVNGRAGLEGTMLGPSILMGRIAGRTVAGAPGPGAAPPEAEVPAPAPEFSASAPAVLKGYQEWLRTIIGTSREGYRHFEMAHAEVLARGLDCRQCHGGPDPAVALTSGSLDQLALSRHCATCHSARE